LYRKPRSAREAELLDEARRLLPAGVRSPTFSPEHAIVVESARGARIRDVSGNEYIDYLLGSGPMLLGHAHPAVVAAVREALERGSTYLLLNEPAILLAGEIAQAVPCAEKVSLHNVGAEATSFAIRLARAYRKRDKILKFEGAYHGMSDWALLSTHWTREPAPFPHAVANSAGIPESVARDVVIAPFNDLEATESLLEQHRDELACVIVEPLQRTIAPAPGFLAGLREMTRRRDIPLVFDEIVTGFRLAFGGAQEYYGVVPDLCAIGKSLSGGHPIAALCGRADLMDRIDPAWAGTSEHVRLSGTYSANPISAVAARATLAELRKPGTYERLFAAGRTLMDALGRLLRDAGIPAQILGEPPAFEVFFADHAITDFRSSLGADRAAHARFVAGLLERGVVKAHEKFFLSLAHTGDDLATTIEAFEGAVAELARSRGRGGASGDAKAQSAGGTA
jgi:glutamate-1-semialdehyde 2,1-aminomutase